MVCGFSGNERMPLTETMMISTTRTVGITVPYFPRSCPFARAFSSAEVACLSIIFSLLNWYKLRRLLSGQPP